MGDEAVQATNEDATSCKLSAVQLGYWRDPYVQLMYRYCSFSRTRQMQLPFFSKIMDMFLLGCYDRFSCSLIK